jgi:DNA-binding transcriptional LysR family regulator
MIFMLLQRANNSCYKQTLCCSARSDDEGYHSWFQCGVANGLTRCSAYATFPPLTESYLVIWELVRQGAAIGVLDAHIGDEDPSVRQVLPNLESLSFPIWLVAHRELTTSRRIRMVYDFLAEELRRG